jgi:hydrogenase expression/formation protein HypE
MPATRGGLASALNEIAVVAGVSMTVDETAVTTTPVVRAARELLGLDPLYVANEGRFAAIVAPGDAARAVEVLRAVEVSRGAAIAGTVDAGRPSLVTLRSRIGGSRVLDLLSGEQLPRIC